MKEEDSLRVVMDCVEHFCVCLFGGGEEDEVLCCYLLGDG